MNGHLHVGAGIRKEELFMKVEQSSFKIFLTSGITLTVKSDELIQTIDGSEQLDLFSLNKLVEECIKNKKDIRFSIKMINTYDTEDGKEEQNIYHYYHIPYDRISWFMIEEVEENN